MAILDLKNNAVVLRIVYAGSPMSGKTESIRSLAALLMGQKALDKKPVYSPEEANGRTLFFDWIDYQAGAFNNYKIRCQIISVPGQDGLKSRREYLLKTADAVLFVVDSHPDKKTDAKPFFDEMQDWLNREDGQRIQFIIQANKQDLANALDKESIFKSLQLSEGDCTFMPSSALHKTGIRESFVSAVGLAIQHTRQLMDQGLLKQGEPEALNGEDLLSIIQHHEAQLAKENALNNPNHHDIVIDQQTHLANKELTDIIAKNIDQEKKNDPEKFISDTQHVETMDKPIIRASFPLQESEPDTLKLANNQKSLEPNIQDIPNQSREETPPSSLLYKSNDTKVATESKSDLKELLTEDNATEIVAVEPSIPVIETLESIPEEAEITSDTHRSPIEIVAEVIHTSPIQQSENMDVNPTQSVIQEKTKPISSAEVTDQITLKHTENAAPILQDAPILTNLNPSVASNLSEVIAAAAAKAKQRILDKKLQNPHDQAKLSQDEKQNPTKAFKTQTAMPAPANRYKCEKMTLGKPAAGTIWPTVAGRIIFNELLNLDGEMYSLDNSLWQAKEGSWSLSSNSRYNDIMNARNDLLRTVKGYIQLSSFLHKKQCVFLAESATQDDWRLWHVSNQEHNLARWIKETLEQKQPNAIAKALLMSSVSYLRLHRHFCEKLLKAPLSLDLLGVENMKPVYLGIILLNQAQDFDPESNEFDQLYIQLKTILDPYISQNSLDIPLILNAFSKIEIQHEQMDKIQEMLKTLLIGH